MDIAAFLARKSTWFEVLPHRPTQTASELASEIHVKGKDLAKAVLLCTQSGFVIAVLPATHFVDLDAVACLLGEKRIALATREQAAAMFPDLEPGVVPLFGSVYGIRTVMDVHLANGPSFVFVGSSRSEAFRIRFVDYVKIETPVMGLISSLEPVQSRRRDGLTKLTEPDVTATSSFEPIR
jgi:Ala-tRNA(Pro) deacylase